MLVVCVSHGAIIHKDLSDKTFVGLFLYRLGANLQDSPEQYQGPACFDGVSVDVGLPSGI